MERYKELYDEMSKRFNNLVVEKQIADLNLKEAEEAIIRLNYDLAILKKTIENRWTGATA